MLDQVPVNSEVDNRRWHNSAAADCVRENRPHGHVCFERQRVKLNRASKILGRQVVRVDTID